MIRMDVATISTLGRNTQGVRLIRFKGGDSIADVTKVVVEEDDEDDEEALAPDESAENGDIAPDDDEN